MKTLLTKVLTVILLCLPISIVHSETLLDTAEHFTIIKKIDAVIVGNTHQFIGNFIIDLFAETYPASKTKYTYL